MQRILHVKVLRTQLSDNLQSTVKQPIWYVVSVDNGATPAATPARVPRNGFAEYNSDLKLTFVPDRDNVYIYYTLCTFGHNKEMIPLARSRSRISKIPQMGVEFKLPMMACNQSNNEAASVYVSITFENGYAPHANTGYMYAPPPPSMPMNPYQSAPQYPMQQPYPGPPMYSPYQGSAAPPPSMPPYAPGVFNAPQAPPPYPEPAPGVFNAPQAPPPYPEPAPTVFNAPPPYPEGDTEANPYEALQTPAPGGRSSSANLAAESAW